MHAADSNLESWNVQGDAQGMTPDVKKELLDILPQSLASCIIPSLTKFYSCADESKDQVCSVNPFMLMSMPPFPKAVHPG